MQYDRLLACRLSVCLWRCVLWPTDIQQVSEQVNRKCPPRNTILQLSIRTLNPQTPSPHNFLISLTSACSYTVRRTTNMSEQANRKSIAAYTMVRPSTPYTYTISLKLSIFQICTSGIAVLSMLPWLLQITVCSYAVRLKSEKYDRLSQQQLCFLYVLVCVIAMLTIKSNDDK